MHQETVPIFKDVCEAVVPFVEWHIFGVEFTQTPYRPTRSQVAVDSRLGVLGSLVKVKGHCVLLGSRVQPSSRIDRV